MKKFIEHENREVVIKYDEMEIKERLKLAIPLPDNLTEKEIDFIEENRLIPVDAASVLLQHMLDTDLPLYLQAYEKRRPQTEKWWGMFLGMSIMPTCLALAYAIVGTEQYVLSYFISIAAGMGLFKLTELVFSNTVELFTKKEKQNESGPN